MTDKELTALVVEDDNASLQVARTALENIGGFTVDLAEDGKVAERHLSVKTPDLLLLDLHLPFVAGGELLDWMRDQKRFSDTSIVIVSSDHDQARELKKKYSELNLSWVPKPIGVGGFKKICAPFVNHLPDETSS